MNSVCKVCSTPFSAPPSTIARGKVTCSANCSYKLRGYYKAFNLRGQKFGYLVVEERLPSTKGKVRWLCRCECGKTITVATSDLKRKDRRAYKSCGCKREFGPLGARSGKESIHWQSPNDISMTYWNAVRKSAKVRKFDFDISIEYAYDQFVKQNGACALTGMPITLNKDASLDRIDSSLGYVTGNIQWLHKRVNNLKSNWNQEEFIEFCRKVTDHAKHEV